MALQFFVLVCKYSNIVPIAEATGMRSLFESHV